MEFRYPPPVAPGDLIAVVAPSSPFAAEDFWRGLAWLRDRYRVLASARVLERHGYLAGDDSARARELSLAMTHAEVKAIVCARGGYGAMRILDDLPWDELVRRPRWVVGFSDVTALHLMANARGLASIHAAHVTGLGREASPVARASWLGALEKPSADKTWSGLTVAHAGRASGPLVGGNLALVEAMAAAGRLDLPPGAIVALEDVNEKPYRLDRMLTALVLGGHLARAAGIVFGEFVRCDPGPDRVTAEEVVVERTRSLGIPVVLGAPFGHGERNEPFVLGARATIEAGLVRITA